MFESGAVELNAWGVDHAQELHWVYGFSNNISNGAIDLRSEMQSHVIGYIAGTVVVIYDLWSHTQVVFWRSFAPVNLPQSLVS